MGLISTALTCMVLSSMLLMSTVLTSTVLTSTVLTSTAQTSTVLTSTVLTLMILTSIVCTSMDLMSTVLMSIVLTSMYLTSTSFAKVCIRRTFTSPEWVQHFLSFYQRPIMPTCSVHVYPCDCSANKAPSWMSLERYRFTSAKLLQHMVSPDKKMKLPHLLQTLSTVYETISRNENSLNPLQHLGAPQFYIENCFGGIGFYLFNQTRLVDLLISMVFSVYFWASSVLWSLGYCWSTDAWQRFWFSSNGGMCGYWTMVWNNGEWHWNFVWSYQRELCSMFIRRAVIWALTTLIWERAKIEPNTTRQRRKDLK